MFDFSLWERDHVLARQPGGRYTCEVCRRSWMRRPKTYCAGVPVYDFNARPPDLKTYTQLRRLKRWPADRAQPDGAYFVRKSPYRRYLYSLAASRPWRVPTLRQQEAIAKMRVGLVEHYTCKRCGWYDASQGKDRYASRLYDGWCGACWQEYHQRQRQIEVCRRLATWASDPGFVIFDCETSGLDYQLDEVLELSIIHSSGAVLFHSLVRPHTFYRGRSLATHIHGLTYEDLESAPQLADVWPQVVAILRRYRRVIAFNAEFDSIMLERSARRYNLRVPRLTWVCLMQEVSWAWGRWSEWHQSYSYISLKGACSLLGVERSDQAHRALGDCQAARAVLYALVTKDGHIDLEAPPAHVPARVRGRVRWTTAESRQPVLVSADGGDAFDPFLDSDDLP